MKNLSAGELLNVWEQGLNRPLLDRSLMLMAAVFPETRPEALAELSIGSRDVCLLLLRERLFGNKLVNNAICPQCAERIEWEQNIADLVAGSAHLSATDRFSLQQDGYSLCFRLPNSKDMAALQGIAEVELAQKRLLNSLIISAEHAGQACEPAQIPEPVVRALNERIEALDPQAEIRIQLTCPACSNCWDVFFDITGFLWAEINDWAERMLQAVHKLARAYGWSECDILNLSPVRRQLYLGMVGP